MSHGSPLALSDLLSQVNPSCIFIMYMIDRIAKLVKGFIRDPRPPPKESSPSPVRPKKTYGFPSTHATALSFYFFYLLPILLSTPTGSVSNAIRIGGFVVDFEGFFYSNGFIAFLVAYWLGGIWSRVKLGYHTPEQVIGGVVFGAGLAMGWRSIWRNNEFIRNGLAGIIDFVWSEGVKVVRSVKAEL
jgi:dolichyldiphosphatase